MLVYIFIFIFILGLRIIFQRKYFVSSIATFDKVEQKTINAFFVASFCLLLFFTGFRAETVGIDTPEYILWFKEFNTLGWERTFHTKKDIEFGYLIICYIVSCISKNSFVLIFVVSFIILVLHLSFLKMNSKNLFVSIILYLSFNHFFTSMSSWRQYIAMGIVFFIYPLLLKKKYLFSLLLMFIGFFFHYSTLLFDFAIIIAYVFSRKKIYVLFFLLFCVIIAPKIFVFIFNSFIEKMPKYAFYESHLVSGSVGRLRTIYIIIEICIILYVLKNKSVKYRNINMMSIMLTFSILCGLLGSSIPLIFRLGYYFDYFLLLIIPELMVVRNKNSTGIQSFFTCFFFLFYFYLILTNSAGILPYRLW